MNVIYLQRQFNWNTVRKGESERNRKRHITFERKNSKNQCERFQFIALN